MQILSSPQLAERWLEYQKERHEHPEKFSLKSTGLIELDNIIGGGIELGQLMYIGGAQKSGKTTLLLHIAKEFARQGVPSLWMGAEMTNMQIGTMMFSNLSGIARDQIRMIGLKEADWEKINKAAEEVRGLPLYWCHGFREMADIKKAIEEVQDRESRAIRAIFVDYIQLMEAPDVKGGRVQEIEAISRRMKHLTMPMSNDDLPRAVIVAAQLNRESIRASIIDANAFLGSGGIERDMDIGIIVSNIKNDTETGDVKYAKRVTVVGSRETDTGSCEIYHNGQTALVGNLATEAVDLNKWA